MSLKEKAQILAIKKAFEYMEKSLGENIPTLVEWLDKFDVKNTLK